MSNKIIPDNKNISHTFNECIANNMSKNNIVTAEIEFMFGMEGKPQPCFKIPINLEVAIIAAIISTIDKENKCN